MKQRVINFYLLVRKPHRTTDENHCGDILTFLNQIMQIDLMTRIVDIHTSQKFYYLSSVTQNGTEINIVFTSAKNKYRGDLINRENGQKRVNPKLISEGEEELTHAVIKIKRNATEMILEKNGNGIGINNIIYYLNSFYEIINGPRDFNYSYNLLLRTDFREHLNRLARVNLAKVYITKSVLGRDTLNLTNRTASVKSDIIIDIKAKRLESIRESAIDVFNKINTGRNSPVKRILVEGKDDSNHKVVLDSLDFYKKETVNLETNVLTGVVISQNAFTTLRRFFTEFND